MSTRKERLDRRRWHNPAPKKLKLAPLTEEDETKIQNTLDDALFNKFDLFNKMLGWEIHPHLIKHVSGTYVITYTLTFRKLVERD